MICVERGYLEPRYENAVWELLVSSDKEFVPPLSARGSTRQKELGPGAVPGTDVPKAYFEDIKKQSMIVAVEDAQSNRVLGFLSYIEDFTLPFLYEGREISVNYVSTIIVNPAFRNMGITGEMYEKLIGKKVPVATRTWSTNHAHIHILERLHFKSVHVIKNDRGAGIDTCYFMKIPWNLQNTEK